MRKIAIFILFAGGILFGTAGRLDWWNAWAFLLVNTASVAAVTFGVFAKSPELEQERATARAKSKGWDRIIVPFVVLLPVVSLVVAGLDRRFGWTNSIAEGASAAALLAVAAGNLLAYRAMRANRFFSSHVRIQSDRGHEVVSSGPYAVVRHPGYTGIALHAIAVGILLASCPAFWVGVLSAGITVLRTALEDRTLMIELPGYRDYAARVRFRLIPGIW